MDEKYLIEFDSRSDLHGVKGRKNLWDRKNTSNKGNGFNCYWISLSYIKHHVDNFDEYENWED